MLEKKIADKLRNYEMDPQSPDLFDAILAERGKQNSKYAPWLFGSIALMFTCIIAFSATKHWGKLPADGKTKAQVIAIKAKEKATYDSIIASHDAIRAEKTKDKEVENDLSNSHLQESMTITQEFNSKKGLKSNSGASANFSVQKNTNVNPILKRNNENDRSDKIKMDKSTTQTSGTGDKVNYIKDSKKTISPIVISDISNWKRKTEIDNITFLSTKRSIKPIHTGDNLVLTNKEQETPKENTNSEKQGLPDWIIPRELNLHFGTYQQNRFANGSNTLSQRINENTFVNQTQQVGFAAEYNIKRSVFAQVGLQWLNYSQRIQDFSYTTTQTSTRTIVDPGGQTSTITVSEDVVSNINGGSSTHNFIEIPISIGSRFTLSKKHILQPQFGVIGSLYSNSNGLTFTDDGLSTESINGKVNRWRNVQMNVVTGFSYTYILGQRFGLYVHPNIRYSLNSQAKKGLQMDELNYMFGAQIGVKYILR